MELLLAFAIGWVVGSRSGEQGFREVVDAAREVRRSEEFKALLDVMRSHLAAGLRGLASVLSDPEADLGPESVLERVVKLVGSRDATSSESAS